MRVKFALLPLWFLAGGAVAADLPWDKFQADKLAAPVEWFLLITALSFLPIIVVSMTTFTRNIIVFSMLRQALGLQQTPPNMVLIALSLFLTLFTMSGPLGKAYDDGVAPYLNKEMVLADAVKKSWSPLKDFMIRQTKETDLALTYQLAKKTLPTAIEDVSANQLIPAFMLSELKVAFQIGFVIFLPFLLVDLVVASILMSLGMIMVPPVTISLPVKLLLFVVIDGWALVAQTLVRSVT